MSDPTSSPLVGAIADDYTGATDLAGMFSAGGVRTIQILGDQPEALYQQAARGCQVVVVALKTRSVAPEVARAESLAALQRLRAIGARQIYFKYCSTFDSTAAGNIGPVTEALLEATGEPFTIAVPALPVNGRTQYLGHLFVGDQLLSDSPMRNHPLNPMTDSNLVTHLQAQCSRPVGLIPHRTVRRGAAAISEAVDRLRASGTGVALVDAIADEDLACIAEAAVDLPLVTGGSGLGAKLPAVWRQRGWIGEPHLDVAPPAERGRVLLIAGSCSARTLEQISAFEQAGRPSIPVNVEAIASGEGELQRVLTRLEAAWQRSSSVLVYSSLSAANRSNVAGRVGGDQGALAQGIERFFADLAVRCTRAGTRRLMVAGGETSGAVVSALGVGALQIGTVLAPGFPHCRVVGERPLDLVLKSGNFGDEEFFLQTAEFLEGGR